MQMDKSYDDYIKELSEGISQRGWTWYKFAEWTVEVTRYFIMRNKMLEEQLKIDNPGDYEALINKINSMAKSRADRGI
jgi:hypothetical protein